MNIIYSALSTQIKESGKKNGHHRFRRWKAGKSWVFSASALALGTGIGATAFPVQNIQANTINDSTILNQNTYTDVIDNQVAPSTIEGDSNDVLVPDTTNSVVPYEDPSFTDDIITSSAAVNEINLFSTVNYTPNVAAVASYTAEYINQLRALNGITTTVSVDPSVQNYAQTRAQDQLAFGGLSHSGNSLGYSENLAYMSSLGNIQSDQELAYHFVKIWYDETDNASPLGNGRYGHRAALLYGYHTTIGYGIATSPTGEIYVSLNGPFDTSKINEFNEIYYAAAEPMTIPLPAYDPLTPPGGLVDPNTPNSVNNPTGPVDPNIPNSVNNPTGSVDPNIPNSVNNPTGSVDPNTPNSVNNPTGLVDPNIPSSVNNPTGLVDPNIPSSVNNPTGLVDPNIPNSGNTGATNSQLPNTGEEKNHDTLYIGTAALFGAATLLLTGEFLVRRRRG